MTYTGLVQNTNYVGTGVGTYAYLTPYVAPVGATLTLKEQSFLTQFFTSGTTLAALATGVAPMGVFDQSGYQVKAKGNLIEFTPLVGSKYPVAISDFEFNIEGVLADIDSAHMQNLFGSTAGEIVTVAPGTGQTGQTITAFGNGKAMKQYTLMLRTPSVLVPIGTGTVAAYDITIFPRVVVVPELDIKYNKKDPTSAKVQFTALSDLNLLSPDNGTPFAAFKVEQTAAAS
jgi:hypothetical protein